MKNSKIVAAMAAAALTVSMMAMPVSADITTDVEGIKIDKANQITYSLTDAGYAPETVDAVTFTFKVDDTEGFGGGLMMQSDANSWDQRDEDWSWGNAEKAITAEGGEGVYTLTFDLDGYFDEFDGEITWAQVVVQQWYGNDITITDVAVTVEGNDDVDTTDAETTDGETTDAETTDEDDYTTGDLDGNGVINVNDIVKLAAHIKGKRMLSAAAIKAADVNGDGKLNINDLVKIAAHVKGKKLLY